MSAFTFFDTHRAFKKLIGVGFTEPQAEFLLEARADLQNKRRVPNEDSAWEADPEGVLKRMIGCGFTERQAEAYLKLHFAFAKQF